MTQELRPAPDPSAPDPWLADEPDARRRTTMMFLNVFVVATCGLVYELVAGAVASYLLGDSITQFSLVIGVYLSAMGLGAWLSKFLVKDLARRFVEVELLVALIGGLSAPILFVAFGSTHAFTPILFFVVTLIGMLVGLELPLLMRILEGELAFKDLVSRTLAFDYAGALVASILFPIVFVPHLGLVRTALLMGVVNAGVGLWGTVLLYGHIGPRVTGLRVRGLIVIVILVVGIIKADSLTLLAEERTYGNPVVYAKSTPYQRIVVTQGPAGFSLFLNGNLQLASADEYRYHEALVHPALLSTTSPKNVLVLGGGDGLALREVYKHPSVEHVTLVDLDPAMTELSQGFPPLAELNAHAYDDPRLTVIHSDAFVWLTERDAAAPLFDAAIVDFPDPNNLGLGKLYTRHFYRQLHRALTEDAAISVQSTSPLLVRKSYWTIVTTIEAAGFSTQPYHAAVPSFGEWGYVLAKKHPFTPPTALGSTLATNLRFLDDRALTGLFAMAPDMQRVDAEVNRLDNQILVRVYDEESKTALR